MPLIPDGFSTPDGGITIRDGGVTTGLSTGANAPIYATVSDGNITADYEDADPMQSIQAAIDALELDTPDGGVIYIHAGNYEFTTNESITITNANIHLIGAGRETIIKKDTGAGTHNTAMFDINNDGCSIQNMTLDCNGSTRDAGNYMIDADTVDSYKGLLIKGVTFDGMNAAGQVCIYKGLGIEVDDCRFDSASADASIWYAPESSCEIKNSIVVNATTDMTYLIRSDASINRFKFINNLVYGNGLTIDLGATGGDGVDSEHWEISNNFIFPETSKPNGIWIDDSNTTGADLIDSIISNNIIEMTTINATGTYGMKLSNVDNCSIIDNKVKIDSTTGTGETYGILAYNSNISNNEVYVDANTTGDTVYGIGSVGDSLKSKIDNNIIYVDGAATNLYGIKQTTACGSICGNNITVNSVDGSTTMGGYGIHSAANKVSDNSIYIGTISAGGGGSVQIIAGIYNPINYAIINGNNIKITDSPNGTNQSCYGIYSDPVSYGYQTCYTSNVILIDCSGINDDATSTMTGIYCSQGASIISNNIIDKGANTDNNSVIYGIDMSSSPYSIANGNVFSSGGWDDQVANIHGTSTEVNSIGLA